MKRKVLDYPNPHRSDEYSWNAQPRMNSEKQQRYRNQRSHIEKRQRYYHKKHEEGRINYDSYEYSWNAQPRMNSKKQRRYHNERSHVEKRQRYYPHRRHEEGWLYNGHYGDRGHDHSICLLVRKQRKERRPDIYPYLFVTEEERALMPLPSPSNKRELDNDDMPVYDDYQPLLDEDDFPVFDHNQYKESLQKLADYWGKACDKARQRESANIINLLDLDYQF